MIFCYISLYNSKAMLIIFGLLLLQMSTEDKHKSNKTSHEQKCKNETPSLITPKDYTLFIL